MSEERWVAPRLTGGLGNRIFQVMATIQTAEETKRTPVFFLPRASRIDHGAYQTLFTLFPSIPILETANSWVEVLEGDRIPPTASLPEAKYGIVLKGLFQQPPKFPSLWPLLLTLPTGLASSGLASQRVAIHFRFGDYLQLPHHQVPLDAYYEEALKQFPNTPLTLFSDEPEKLQPIASKWQQEGRDVEISTTKDELQTLQEIASCQEGFIGCNSTFGFWASWFAWNSHKRPSSYKAIFPDTWMKEGHPNHKPTFLATDFSPFIILLRL